MLLILHKSFGSIEYLMSREFSIFDKSASEGFHCWNRIFVQRDDFDL